MKTVDVHTDLRRVALVGNADTLVELLDLVILEQRVPLPIVRQQDPTMIGVLVKTHAEEVKGLPFVPFSGAPDVTHRRHHSALTWQLNPHGDGVPEGGRVQVINNPNPVLLLAIIHAAQAHERIEQQVRFATQQRRDVMDGGRLDRDRRVHGIGIKGRNGLAKALPQDIVDRLRRHVDGSSRDNTGV